MKQLGAMDVADRAPVALFAGTGSPASAAIRTRTAYKTPTGENSDVRVLVSRAEFDALSDEWRELEQQAAGAIFFQSFEFCRAVWDHHQRNGHNFQPVILVLRIGGRLAGLLPLQQVGPNSSFILTGFGEPYQQYTDILLAPGAPDDAARRLLESARALKGCDGFNFLKVRDDSALAPLLRAMNAIRSNDEAAPFVDLRPFPDFKSYLSTINSKTRKNMRNARNRLARDGALDHRVLTEAADIDALVTRAYEGRERWLEQQGLTSRAFRDPSFGAFSHAASQKDSGLHVLAMSLTLGGRPIADQWGFIFNGRYYAYLATWAPEFEESSPGKLHLEEVIRSCHERGIGIADFLVPAVRYKFTWTDQAMPVADYALGLSWRSRLMFGLWAGTVRPVLKDLALMLPPSIRGAITRIVLRRK